MVQVHNDRGRMGQTNDEEVGDEHEQPPDFRRFTLPMSLFSILMLMKAALFTAIVTAFAIDVISDLDEDTSTKLLRIIAEQSTAGLGIDIPQPNPPKSIMLVTTLWLFSLMSSLAATTWAILSLEWCAFLAEGVQAEDYEEMAEKRQKKLEAVRYWKMHLVVASIPFFLHLSLFLFITGLWLRLRDIDRRFGLVVGIPGLVIGSSYIIVSLLPIFTDAPFPTSVSEMVSPLVKEIRYLIGVRHYVHAPPIFPSISRPVVQTLEHLRPFLHSCYTCLSLLLHAMATSLITSTKYIYEHAGRYVLTTTTGILLPVLPTFRISGDPFKELNKLRIGLSHDFGVQQRALFWLMNTPLTHSEVKEVLEELRRLGSIEGPLDRGIVKLLVLSLSSVLEDGQITRDEQPIFDHCTKLLTEEMDRVFRDAEYNPTIVVRNTMISERLSKYLDFDISHPPSPGCAPFEEYWNNAVRLLWLSPSTDKTLDFAKQLKSDVVRSMQPPLLARVIRGLHAATITSLNPKIPTLDFPLPDFGRWDFSRDGWAGDPPDKDLLAYLRNILAEFHKVVHHRNKEYQSPTTITSLVTGCLESLDDPPPDISIPLEFHGTLCFFIAVGWRTGPGVFGTGRSVANALVKSALSVRGASNHSGRRLAVRLRAIAYGPKHLTSKPNAREAIAHLYASPTDSLESATYSGLTENDAANPGQSLVWLPELIHAIAATLEAVLSGEAHNGVPDLRIHADRKIVQNTVPASFFTDSTPFNYSHENQDHRLPYLYSLAIALSHGFAVGVPGLLRIFRWLRAPGEQEEGAAVEKILDTNTLVVTVLRLALAAHQPNLVLTEEGPGDYSNQITETLRSLQDIIGRRDDYSWRVRWKSIYLVGDINFLLNRAPTLVPPQTVIDNANRAVELYLSGQRDLQVKWERVPRDWDGKKGELTHWEVGEKIGELAARGEASEVVYKWKDPGRVPHLSLYPQEMQYDPSSWAPYRLLEKLQQ